MQNFFFIKLLVILSIFMGCAAKKGYLPPTPTENSLPEKQKVVRAQQTEEQYALNKSGRVVLFDASFSIETDNPDSVHSQLVEMSRKYDGYILESRNNMTAIRIPSKNLYQVIDEVNKLGKIISKNITGKDVTEEYRDLETRLDNIQKTRERYLELFSKANDVTSVLKIEKELERLSREIDLLKGKLNRLSHLEQFSTITVITVNPKTKSKPGPLGYVFVGIYKFLKFLIIWD